MTRAEWLEHSTHMGVEQMGGRAPVGAPRTSAPVSGFISLKGAVVGLTLIHW
jgi:hypothetical protein